MNIHVPITDTFLVCRSIGMLVGGRASVSNGDSGVGMLSRGRV